METQNGLLGERKLAATRVGQGDQTVVLVHGWTCRRSHWQSLLSCPVEGFSLLAVDLPGHGDSRAIPLDAWTVAGQAQALVEALEGVDNPVLAGHSMGGAVVLEAARRMAVKAVLLVDTFVIPYGDLDEDSARQVEQPFHDDFPAAIDNLVQNNAGPSMAEADKAALAEDMAAAPVEAMLPLWGDLLRWSPDAAFAELSCPIHAINGDLIGEVARARCAGRVSEWHQPGTWHFPQMEQPEVFRALFCRVMEALRS
ncbi:MAG: alpha/beta hydrolase [Pseudomonadales bacterium]|nr:alpha/beta hydrolase [Pseudomonadales bacterium]